tara:strand:+ start:1904 stop:2509 length:606 start_codon:yes stop_codon:yes gene_type:complete
MENHKFLTNSVLVILISGIILASIGNYILYKYSDSEILNLKTCDEKLLEEARGRKGNNERNGYTLSFTGYIVTGMGLLFLIILSTFLSTNSKNGDIDNLKNILTSVSPIFLTLLVVSYVVSLNINYKDRFISGNLSNDFFSYLSFFSIMFLIQIIILSKYIRSLSENSSNNEDTVIYALSLINILILVVMNITLKFFSTDG